MMIRLSISIGAAAIVLAMACDPGAYSNAAPGSCQEAGSQCQLTDGPLGVCERSGCATGATPPCFLCVSQH